MGTLPGLMSIDGSILKCFCSFCFQRKSSLAMEYQRRQVALRLVISLIGSSHRMRVSTGSGKLYQDESIVPSWPHPSFSMVKVSSARCSPMFSSSPPHDSSSLCASTAEFNIFLLQIFAFFGCKLWWICSSIGHFNFSFSSSPQPAHTLLALISLQIQNFWSVPDPQSDSRWWWVTAIWFTGGDQLTNGKVV